MANTHFLSLFICHVETCKDGNERKNITVNINSLKRDRLEELVIQGARLHNQGNIKGTVIVIELFREDLGGVGGAKSPWCSPEYEQEFKQELVTRIDELKKVSWRSRLSTWLGFGVETSGAVSVSSHPPENPQATPNTAATSSLPSSSPNDSSDNDDDHSLDPASQTEQPALPTEKVSDVISDDSPQPAELLATKV